MWYPALLLAELGLIPFVSLGNIGAVGILAGLVVLGAVTLIHRMRLSLRTLILVVGGLVLFDAPYNLQRVAYQLLTVAAVAVFFVHYETLSRRARIHCMAVVAVALLASMGVFAAGSVVGLDDAYADWAILCAIPFFFLVRLVDRPGFTIVASLAFAWLLLLLDNVAALAFPTALLFSRLLPARVRVTRALLLGLAASGLVTFLTIRFAVFIPQQGFFMRSVIWNEMFLRLTSSLDSLIFGISRFKEAGYVWLTDSSLLLDPRQSDPRSLLFNEMAHNYVFATLVFGGLKGVLVLWLFLRGALRDRRFDSRMALGIFGAVILYLTFDGFKLLSPDGVSICSTILLYAASRGDEVIVGAREPAVAQTPLAALSPAPEAS